MHSLIERARQVQLYSFAPIAVLRAAEAVFSTSTRPSPLPASRASCPCADSPLLQIEHQVAEGEDRARPDLGGTVHVGGCGFTATAARDERIGKEA